MLRKKKKSKWLGFLLHMLLGGVNQLYHFTDVQNVPLIEEAGGLYCWQLLCSKGIIPPRPGGDDWSHRADMHKGIDNYVHLSFVPDHPMQYKAENEGRIGPCVVFRIKPQVIYWEGTLFSPDNAIKRGVHFGTTLEDFRRIRFKMLYGKPNFQNPAYHTVRKSEVMVQDFIDKQFIKNFNKICKKYGQVSDISSSNGKLDLPF